jgi:hypothetical protein
MAFGGIGCWFARVWLWVSKHKMAIHVEWVTCVYIHTTNFVLIIFLGAHTEERVRECILVCTWTHMSGLGGSMTAHNI